jgi:acyl CoA:acetate/3-ketoacid CoA transferase alpha subunit/acyl CoA:acetate/3-ketoacid CoA transferase beta subunit
LAEGTDKLQSLSFAVTRHVRPRMHLHFASSPSRSNASIREIARAFRGTCPEFTLSATGFHSTAHLLAMLRLGKRYISCFFGDNYPTPRPNALYRELSASGVELEHWSLWSYVSALRAGALGHAYGVTNSLSGTTLGDELAYKGRFVELSDPRQPDRAIGLVAALRPDIAFVHAAAGDREGNVIASPPYSEGFWGALGAKTGVIVTVDHLVDAEVCRKHADWIRIPPYRVLAICRDPFGAHPQPSFIAPRGLPVLGYRDDFEHYELWREMTTDSRLFTEFSRLVLDAEDGALAYRAFVGEERLQNLRADAWSEVERLGRRGEEESSNGVHEQPLSANERLVVLAARTIARRVVAGKYRTILAGIGWSFAAARLAKCMLDDKGIAVEVMVETGLADIECGPSAHPFLLASVNMEQARRLSSVEDVLGTLTCGAHNECLGVVGAAEIDANGNINSTRLASGELLVGSGGASDIASSCREVVAVVRCDRERLVPRVHYVTSRGRAVLHIATDRCVLSRAAPGEPWTIRDVYREEGTVGEAVRRIVERCGFALSDSARDWTETPSPAERAALRSVVDEQRERPKAAPKEEALDA